MPHWLQLMLDSLPRCCGPALIFTVPLTLLSFVLGLPLGLGAALVRLFGPRRWWRWCASMSGSSAARRSWCSCS